MPQEVVIEDKTAVEQMRLIQQLDEEDKQTIFRLIDKMLTKIRSLKSSYIIDQKILCVKIDRHRNDQ